jgi:hypothetical protein
MNNFKKFLRSISVSDVILMSNIRKNIFITKTSRANYYHQSKGDLSNFVFMLQINTLYSMIPMLTINSKSDKPYQNTKIYIPL